MLKIRLISTVVAFVVLFSILHTDVHARGEIYLNNPLELHQLTGLWRFSRVDRPEFKYTDFNDSSWEWLPVPGHWNSLDVKGVEVGWYRFRFKLAPSFPNMPISILAPAIADSHEFFINGKKIGGFGKISAEGVILSKANHPAVLAIPKEILNKEDYNVIALRVGDNVGWGGVVNSEFYIGNSELIELKYNRNNIWNLSVVIILGFLSLYSAALYFYLSKEKSFLHFSFLAFMIGLTLLGYFYYGYWIVNNYWFNHIAFHMGINTAMAISLRFAYSFLDRKPDWILRAVTLLSILLVAVLLLTPLSLSIYRFYARVTLNIALLLDIVGFFFLVYLIIKSIWLNQPGALISGLGSMVILACFLAEILSYLLVLDLRRFILEGTVIFMICISYGLFIKH